MSPRSVLLLVFLVVVATSVCPAAGPGQFTYPVTGLFSPDREQDLRETMKEIPGIKVVRVDFDRAEVTLEYDPATAFPGAKPEQVVQRLDNQVRTASRSTFGIKAPSTVPAEKLKRVEIRVAGLDCKACALAAYEAVYKLDGVERATASFREGRVTAMIDPTRTDVAKLEEALTKRGVQVVKP